MFLPIRKIELGTTIGRQTEELIELSWHSTTKQSLNKFNKPFKRSHWFKPQRTSTQPRTETNRTFTKPISYLNHQLIFQGIHSLLSKDFYSRDYEVYHWKKKTYTPSMNEKRDNVNHLCVSTSVTGDFSQSKIR